MIDYPREPCLKAQACPVPALDTDDPCLKFLQTLQPGAEVTMMDAALHYAPRAALCGKSRMLLNTDIRSDRSTKGDY
jgi:hypothetical protein